MTDTTTLRRYLTKRSGPEPIFCLKTQVLPIDCEPVRNGAFEGNLGSANANVQGETQKTLIFPGQR
jgi:hypothetical protein